MKNKFGLWSTLNGSTINYEIGKFPGGEIRVKLHKLNAIIKGDEIHIKAHLFNSDDIMTLVMMVDSLRESGIEKIRLTMPYIPYARQDRVCNPGEALSIRAFAKIINSLGFASVAVYDPHSAVASTLIDRCLVIPSQELMMEHGRVYTWICRGGWSANPIYLVSPDKGSVSKTELILKTFPQFSGIIYADKERDLATGNIIKTIVKSLPEDIANAKLLIADDICDGGRTFIEIAKILKPQCEEINLYVTHGIFSQGKDILEKYFDNVWSTIDFEEYK